MQIYAPLICNILLVFPSNLTPSLYHWYVWIPVVSVTVGAISNNSFSATATFSGIVTSAGSTTGWTGTSCLSSSQINGATLQDAGEYVLKVTTTVDTTSVEVESAPCTVEVRETVGFGTSLISIFPLLASIFLTFTVVVTGSVTVSFTLNFIVNTFWN